MHIFAHLLFVNCSVFLHAVASTVLCLLLPWTKKKEPCCWCIKSESCDIEEPWSLIQLRNREQTWLATVATSRINASQRNQAADSSTSHGASLGWFFFFGQGSSYLVTATFVNGLRYLLLVLQAQVFKRLSLLSQLFLQCLAPVYAWRQRTCNNFTRWN